MGDVQIQILQFLVLSLITNTCLSEVSLWAKWWSYRGISGPKYWGILNSQWRLCSQGKRQSPINIDMEMLLFDPSLGVLEVEETWTSGTLMNNGNEVTLKINDTSSEGIFITSGPLSYKYRVHYVKFHFGSEGMNGGEHQIGGLTFPAELQIMAYNCDLYDNFTQAEKSPHGITGVAVFVQVGPSENEDFDILAHSMSKVRFQGQFVTLNKLKIAWLLPNTTQFLTYEGSLTQPGCYETVTWVIMNRPVYVSLRQLELLKSLNKGGFEDSQMLLETNSRPIKPVNHRVIRTNINFKRGCTMARNISFEAKAVVLLIQTHLAGVQSLKEIPQRYSFFSAELFSNKF